MKAATGLKPDCKHRAVSDKINVPIVVICSVVVIGFASSHKPLYLSIGGFASNPAAGIGPGCAPGPGRFAVLRFATGGCNC